MSESEKMYSVELPLDAFKALLFKSLAAEKFIERRNGTEPWLAEDVDMATNLCEFIKSMTAYIFDQLDEESVEEITDKATDDLIKNIFSEVSDE